MKHTITYKHLVPLDCCPELLINKLGEVFDTIKGIYIEPTLMSIGYLSVKGKYLHRLVAQTFIPNPNDFDTVNHLDGDKTNNNIDNLEWCSQAKNAKHALEVLDTKSNRPRKLTEDDYRYLFYNRFLKGESISKIAESGVNQAQAQLGQYIREVATKDGKLDEYYKEVKRQQQALIKQRKGKKVKDRVVQKLDTDGNVLKEYKTFTEPAFEVSGSRTNDAGIRRAIRRKSMYKGYYWNVREI